MASIFLFQLLLQKVDCDTFTPVLWSLLVMSLSGIFSIFFHGLTIFLSSTAVAFLGWPVPCLVFSIPLFYSGFFFQTVVLNIPSACAITLIPLFSALKWLAFLPQTALWYPCCCFFVFTMNAAFTGEQLH